MPNEIQQSTYRNTQMKQLKLNEIDYTTVTFQSKTRNLRSFKRNDSAPGPNN